jgi:glucosamine-6-phosphate deaminase
MSLCKKLTADNMRVEIYDTRTAMGDAAGAAAAAHLRALLAEKDEVNVIFAAAPSQNEMVAALIASPDIDWTRVNAFHMDEYIGLSAEAPQGFGNFLDYCLFSKVAFKAVYRIDCSATDAAAECARYEAKIKNYGGIHLFLGGIGPDGHIAFNEPGSSLSSRTRKKELTTDTIIANSRFFDNDVNKVPKTALTVGVGTVMDAQEVLIVVNGHNKARALQHAIEEPISHMWTVSALQMHPHGIIVCDEAACDELRLGTYKYFKDIERNNLDPNTIL